MGLDVLLNQGLLVSEGRESPNGILLRTEWVTASPVLEKMQMFDRCTRLLQAFDSTDNAGSCH
jgi:hypothetical protein